MKGSKKSKKEPISPPGKVVSKKLIYSLILLLGANAIVLVFLIFFLSRLFSNQGVFATHQPIQVPPIPISSTVDKPFTTASSYIVYDPRSRTIVYAKNERLRFAPASSIKILSALVALDYYDPDEYLIVKTVAAPDDSRMGLYYGEEISVRDLLYGLLMASGNDAAKTLAYYYPGGTDGFVAAMNKKAQDIGLIDSFFLDPSGYADGNYSTAFELSRLASVALNNDLIREIVKTKNAIVYDRYGTYVHPLKNLNELLVNPNVTGVKTGFTNEAGGVLITSYEHKGNEFIIVVMKSDDRFADTQSIMQFIDTYVDYSSVTAGVDTGVDLTAGM